MLLGGRCHAQRSLVQPVVLDRQNPLPQAQAASRLPALPANTLELSEGHCRLPHPRCLPLQFDTDNGGSLSLDEYIRSCLFLQTAARTFGAFDQQRTVRSCNCLVPACQHVSLPVTVTVAEHVEQMWCKTCSTASADSSCSRIVFPPCIATLWLLLDHCRVLC